MITDNNSAFLAKYGDRSTIDHILDSDIPVKSSLSENPNLRPHHIEKLLNSDDWTVRASLSHNRNLQPHHIDKLVNDKNWAVRWNICRHPNLQQHHIDKLLNDEHYNVVSYMSYILDEMDKK